MLQGLGGKGQPKVKAMVMMLGHADGDAVASRRCSACSGRRSRGLGLWRAWPEKAWLRGCCHKEILGFDHGGRRRWKGHGNGVSELAGKRRHSRWPAKGSGGNALEERAWRPALGVWAAM